MSVAQLRSAAPRRLRFGHCVLDEGLGSLTAPDGTASVLRPKTFELLRVLLSQAGRVVSREEILDAVWPGLFVTDDSVTQCVVEIRKAMGQGGAGLLKTVPRRGYLLQAQVIEDAPAGAAPALLSPRPDDRPSIAVLPFRKDQPDPKEAWFADGIIEGIVHVLSGLERILVVSRGSALALAETTVDPREVGRALGVRYVLYGGVRRAGERLRITTELSEAETGAIIRSDRYEGETGDLFALQDRISEQVIATIAPQVRERELVRALRKAPESLTAYDLVLRALDKARRVDKGAMAEAEAMLRQAVEMEPHSPVALSNLALLLILRIAEGWAVDMAATFLESGALAQAAVDRDPADPLSLAIRAHTLSYLTRDYESAERMVTRAMQSGPSCAWAWAWGSATAGYRGDMAEAVRRAERAIQLAPADPFAHMFEHVLSQAHYLAGDAEAAVHWACRSATSNPHHAPNQRVMIAALVALDRIEEACAAALQLRHGDPGFGVAAFAARTPLPAGVRETFCKRLKTAGLPD